MRSLVLDSVGHCSCLRPIEEDCLYIDVEYSCLVLERQCLEVPDRSKCVKSMSGLIDQAL